MAWDPKNEETKGTCMPTPYSRRKPDGSHIGPEQVAEEAAKHLSEQQWVSMPPTDAMATDVVRERPPEQEIRLEFTRDELRTVLRKFKRHKSPGPDQVPMEFYK
eukprot:3733588-Prorocentrum_lima.AAC.1